MKKKLKEKKIDRDRRQYADIFSYNFVIDFKQSFEQRFGKHVDNRFWGLLRECLHQKVEKLIRSLE